MKTIQTTINGTPVLLVQLPEDERFQEITPKQGIAPQMIKYFILKVDENHGINFFHLPSPPTGYTWRFINLTKDVTEEQAKETFDMELADLFHFLHLKGVHGEHPLGELWHHAKYNRVHGRTINHGVMEYKEYKERWNQIEQSRLSTWGLIVGEKV